MAKNKEKYVESCGGLQPPKLVKKEETKKTAKKTTKKK